MCKIVGCNYYMWGIRCFQSVSAMSRPTCRAPMSKAKEFLHQRSPKSFMVLVTEWVSSYLITAKSAGMIVLLTLTTCRKKHLKRRSSGVSVCVTGMFVSCVCVCLCVCHWYVCMSHVWVCVFVCVCVCACVCVTVCDVQTRRYLKVLLAREPDLAQCLLNFMDEPQENTQSSTNSR